jgi:release factor glutamine methyltransferase
VSDSIPQLIAEKAKRLEQAGIDVARVEVEWILCSVLGVDRLNLFLHGSQFLDDSKLAEIDKIISKRTTRYPLQYILEESWFYGRKFFVSPAVMVPTPETELLCGRGLEFIRKKKAAIPRILDLGVGSGVIAVTIAAELKDVALVALDISEEALDVARRNADDHDCIEKIEFRKSDFFSAMTSDERFDLIVSNPPYIREPDYAGLPPEVKADPKIALTAGEDGLSAIRAILSEAPKYLADNGRIMFEIGFGQSVAVAELTEGDDRYREIDIVRDLNNIDRLVILACRR